MATTGKVSRRIRIKTVPDGFTTPFQIKSAWVGEEFPVEMEFPEDIRQAAEKRRLWVVAKDKALEILRDSGKLLAADYWEVHCGSGFFCFRPEHCEEVTG